MTSNQAARLLAARSPVRSAAAVRNVRMPQQIGRHVANMFIAERERARAYGGDVLKLFRAEQLQRAARTQTEALTEQLANLRAAVAAVTQQLRRGDGAPGRVVP